MVTKKEDGQGYEASWEEVDGAHHYLVYFGDDPKATEITDTSIDIPEGAQSVRVVAVDENGKEAESDDRPVPPSGEESGGGEDSDDDNSTDEPQRGPSPRPTSPTPTSPHAKETPG